MFLNIALCYYFYICEKPRIKHVLIYTITILTTMSTSGIIGLTLLLLTYVLFSRNISLKTKLLTIVVSIAVIIFSYSGISDKLYYAITKINDASNPSTIARIGSVYANLHMWIRYPLFGIGLFENQIEFSRIITKAFGITFHDNTNTYLFLLSSFGTFFGAVIFIGTYRFSRLVAVTKWRTPLVMLFFVVIFSGENLSYSFIPYLIIMYGYQTRICKWKYWQLILEITAVREQ